MQDKKLLTILLQHRYLILCAHLFRYIFFSYEVNLKSVIG